MLGFTRRRALLGPSSQVVSSNRSQAAWPNRPITLMYGLAAGGPIDVISRTITDGLSKQRGQQNIVESRLGADAMTVAAHVARMAPDGHTLLASPSGFAVAAAMTRSCRACRPRSEGCRQSENPSCFRLESADSRRAASSLRWRTQTYSIRGVSRSHCSRRR
jgi:hypothetical protein